MKVFLIGGTGLIGSSVAKNLISYHHEVTTMALPPVPLDADIPSEMTLILKNFMQITDLELMEHMKGFDVFVFAAGIDERVEGKPPVYDMYYNFNISALKRLLEICKRVQIQHAVIMGSYFSYFDRLWKDLQLSAIHPYIRSRVDQENMALGFSEAFRVSILELPYIFGIQKGREPVWTFLVKQIQKMKCFTFYPNGGTTMVTANQVGVITRHIIENQITGSIPIGYYEMSWKEMLSIMHKEMGIHRPILTAPKWIYRIVLRRIMKRYQKRNIESGLNLIELAEIMYRKAYLQKEDMQLIMKLGIPTDDIEEAIKESTKLSMEFLSNKSHFVSMKTE